MYEEDYVTIDFRPAPTGWKVVHLDSAGWCRFVPQTVTRSAGTPYVCATCNFPKLDERHRRLHYAALPGWLIQEEKRSKERRVMAAELNEDGELVEVMAMGRWNTSAWYILGPDEATPTVEDVIDVRDRREREQAAWRARAKQVAAA